jgi:hypothetical protein
MLVPRIRLQQKFYVFFKMFQKFTALFILAIVYFRFANPDAVRQLPVWVRPHVNKYDAFGLALKDVMVFFKTAEKMVHLDNSLDRNNYFMYKSYSTIML